MTTFTPADYWIFCVLYGHNPDADGKCQRCGESESDEAAA